MHVLNANTANLSGSICSLVRKITTSWAPESSRCKLENVVVESKRANLSEKVQTKLDSAISILVALKRIQECFHPLCLGLVYDLSTVLSNDPIFSCIGEVCDGIVCGSATVYDVLNTVSLLVPLTIKNSLHSLSQRCPP